jgi:hypothetical protein
MLKGGPSTGRNCPTQCERCASLNGTGTEHVVLRHALGQREVNFLAANLHGRQNRSLDLLLQFQRRLRRHGGGPRNAWTRQGLARRRWGLGRNAARRGGDQQEQQEAIHGMRHENPALSDFEQNPARQGEHSVISPCPFPREPF